MITTITLCFVGTAIVLYAIAMWQVHLAAMSDRADTVNSRQCGRCGRFAAPGVQRCTGCGAETLPIRT